MLNQNQPKTASNWPFPITNGERSYESKNLIDGKKPIKEKIDVTKYEEAPF